MDIKKEFERWLVNATADADVAAELKMLDTRLLYFNNVNQLLELSLAVLALFFAFITSSREKKSTLREFPYLRKVCVSTIISFMIVYASEAVQQGKRVRVTGRRQGIRNHRRQRRRMVYRPYTQLFLIVPLPLTDSH